MPYPMSTPGQDSASGNSKRWPAFPGIPIFLETHDERAAPKTYGTTPTTPTTPEILAHGQSASSNSTHLAAPEVSPVATSPTTTIQTSSARSSVWPIPEPPPEIQHQPPRRPALQFFPTQRPRVRLDGMPTLQIPQFNEKSFVNEKTPINVTGPGLGITGGPPKPPTIQISSPISVKSEYPPSNIAQRIEERLWTYTRSGNILKRWLVEILSWLFSALCMIAIIAVLVILKDQKLTKWSLAEKTGLTLNAYISILSKMAGASLILPVSEALGQLKWSWFLDHSKQMWDFEIFDNASRGPWGSLLLLIRTKGKSLAALGALVTLASLALDPFFQQVVDFPDRWALTNTSSSIPRVIQYSPVYTPEFFQGIETTLLNDDVRAVVAKFFTGNGTQPVPFGNVQLNGDVGTVVLWTPDIDITPPASKDNVTDLVSSNKSYHVDNMTVSNAIQTFDYYFPSYYTVKNDSNQPMLRYRDYLDGPSYLKLSFNPFQAPNNISRHMERLATALTNVIRSDVKSRDMIPGKAYSHENYVLNQPPPGWI
ncbi:hypothetical protein E8E12_006425 [Didymella heteroderae]|uniref:Uncharacterized protein n=1 Tax=Didymella heteroderae TaxID=1769908 RepID=A0A9P4WWR5_9PLEO|nr:hypothetical protein E8E12_006425 [Didymella heteroderae]